MKKILLIIAIFLTLPEIALAISLPVSSVPDNSSGTLIPWTCQDNSDKVVFLYSDASVSGSGGTPPATLVSGWGAGGMECEDGGFSDGYVPDQWDNNIKLYFFEVNDSGGIISGAGQAYTISDWEASPDYVAPLTTLVVGTDPDPSPPPPSPSDPLGDQIRAAEAGMASTSGIHVQAAVAWAGDNLIKLFIGSGLGIIYNMRYWIAALAALAVVIGFSLKAFRFFRT